MNEKFSPAPWKVDINKGGDVWVIDEKENDVACVFGSLNTQKTDEVNASLISAAPEMYHALEAICIDCDGSCVMNDYNKNCRGCTIPNLLNKARGEK